MKAIRWVLSLPRILWVRFLAWFAPQPDYVTAAGVKVFIEDRAIFPQDLARELDERTIVRVSRLEAFEEQAVRRAVSGLLVRVFPDPVMHEGKPHYGLYSPNVMAAWIWDMDGAPEKSAYPHEMGHHIHFLITGDGDDNHTDRTFWKALSSDD